MHPAVLFIGVLSDGPIVPGCVSGEVTVIDRNEHTHTHVMRFTGVVNEEAGRHLVLGICVTVPISGGADDIRIRDSDVPRLHLIFRDGEIIPAISRGVLRETGSLGRECQRQVITSDLSHDTTCQIDLPRPRGRGR